MNQFISIGLKVLAAAGVGIAVYFGVEKITKSNNSQDTNSNNSSNGDGGNNSEPLQCNNDSNLPVKNQPSSGEKIVTGLKVAQDIFGRSFSLCQNIAMAVENISKIFSSSSMQPSYGGGGYYNDHYGNMCYDKYKDPPGYRRLSPFILEYVGGPVDSRMYNQVPGNY